LALAVANVSFSHPVVLRDLAIVRSAQRRGDQLLVPIANPLTAKPAAHLSLPLDVRRAWSEQEPGVWIQLELEARLATRVLRQRGQIGTPPPGKRGVSNLSPQR